MRRRRLEAAFTASALSLAAASAALTAAPREASAFCGFYVSGADAKLFNNATQVVLMREGTRTVLSMQNNYQGPPSDFAMVVPVPVVLQKDNVKTLTRDIFDKVDKLSAPRLVEYWEQDPCQPQMEYKGGPIPPPSPMMKMEGGGRPTGDLGVTIEAKFTVGEYQVLILSAKDSTGLDTWLRQEKYKIPEGAEPYLRPYVVAGMKFFVAKVDIAKVKYEKGMATLSPLRFHYDSELFNLPVRLGLMNSAGTQDLIVNVLARGSRYEVANYDNIAIPTNIDVQDKVRKSFPAFYAALFDRAMAKHPKAVITEYSWDASWCDPCPLPALTPPELAVLGTDVLPPAGDGGGGSFVLTRLHARYNKDALGEDLVFRAAAPIAGGREFTDNTGKLERGFIKAESNTFQARYAIRHAWTGPVKCQSPRRGIWGGPPHNKIDAEGNIKGPVPATNLAFAPRGEGLNAFVKAGAPVDPGFLASAANVPVTIAAGPSPSPTDTGSAAPDAGPGDADAGPKAETSGGAAGPPPVPPEGGGCAGCRVGQDDEDGGGAAPVGLLVAGALGVAALIRRKRRR
jgi:MYXO-CTERM domain-containing protein